MSEQSYPVELLVGLANNTTSKMHNDGRLEITCKHNKWSVNAEAKDAIREAIHYYQVYSQDGLYDEPNPTK